MYVRGSVDEVCLVVEQDDRLVERHADNRVRVIDASQVKVCGHGTYWSYWEE